MKYERFFAYATLIGLIGINFNTNIGSIILVYCGIIYMSIKIVKRVRR